MLNRCRFEKRMKRLAELQTKNTLINNHISTPEPNVTRSTTPEPTMSPKGIFRKTYLSLNYFLCIFKHIHLILIYLKKRFIPFPYVFYLRNFSFLNCLF
jgi:hypothetical protein